MEQQNGINQQQNNGRLAGLFARLFTDRAEADWAFDLLRDTARRLQVSDPYDPRLAVTLSERSGKLFLRLNFGAWLVLGFRGPGQVSERVDMALLAGAVAWDERFSFLPYEPKEGEPEVRGYELPLEVARPMTSDLRRAYEASLDFIAEKFRLWKRAIHWKLHRPEIVEAFFDLEKRAQLFAGGLDEPEFQYERYFTAFHHELAEEEGEYEVDPFIDNEGMAVEEESDVGREISSEQIPQKATVINSKQEGLEKMLKAAFAEFREDLQDRFVVKLRRKRVEQLRELLSNPETVDLETFNREVWVSKSGPLRLRGINISNYDSKMFDKELIKEMEQALDSGELELHGNHMWGSATKVYAPRLSDDTEKIKHLHQALDILNDSELTPIKKAQEIIKIYGFGNNIATGLVMVFHPTEFGLYNNEGKRILENLGYETYTSLDTYEDTLDRLKEKLEADDFLELDWFLYRVNQGKYPAPKNNQLDNPVTEELTSEDETAFSPTYPLSQLSEDTGFDEATLKRWLRAIERKKQVILYGPPGTGKTFVAEKLARYLTSGGDGFWELVQFHPAYAYEDFVQGLRPKPLETGGLDYPLAPGRFLAFCRKAQGRQDCCVLIIDEINRADLARVFGELMYLLEYRERAIELAGGGERFQIPENVRLIGTMNTADRSIALVDHALRRRFAFVALKPEYDVLRRYHEGRQTDFGVEGLIGVLARLNRQIGDPHYEVGIAFFLRDDLGAEIEDIWRMEIEPYLEEYFFDRPEDVEAFRWAQVEQGIKGG